ncbi:MAG: sensor histidine kinase, partial [Myxococcota bacterium]
DGTSHPLAALLDRVPADERDAVCATFRRALDPVSGGVYEGEFWVGSPPKRIQAHGRVCFSGGGRPLRFTGVIADVTRRHEADAQMGRLNAWLEDRVVSRTRELEEANRELQAFSDSVTHDLRAPLRSIAGFAALLADRAGDRLSASDQRDLARIRAAVTRASTIMDDLLGLSRVGRCPLAARPIDLAEIAREVVASLRQADPDRVVDVRIPDRLRAVGDPGLVRILLDNLLSNAWKFTRPAPTPVIELGVEPTDAGPVYFVRDNGVGFDPALADRLFLPFERLHDGRAFEGTGIGLATAQRIVARHGGTISGTSTAGHGATFRFTLPGS